MQNSMGCSRLFTGTSHISPLPSPSGHDWSKRIVVTPAAIGVSDTCGSLSHVTATIRTGGVSSSLPPATPSGKSNDEPPPMVSESTEDGSSQPTVRLTVSPLALLGVSPGIALSAIAAMMRLILSVTAAAIACARSLLSSLRPPSPHATAPSAGSHVAGVSPSPSPSESSAPRSETASLKRPASTLSRLLAVSGVKDEPPSSSLRPSARPMRSSTTFSTVSFASSVSSSGADASDPSASACWFRASPVVSPFARLPANVSMRPPRSSRRASSSACVSEHLSSTYPASHEHDTVHGSSARQLAFDATHTPLLLQPTSMIVGATSEPPSPSPMPSSTTTSTRPGHSLSGAGQLSSQYSSSKARPRFCSTHVAPSREGAGFVHARSRRRAPTATPHVAPHVASHSPHSLHCV
mmetsp:Transcript_3705/g.13626  ORF Transcript_3705/g.13626 Transcript_3705/m.13626 type:complete len:409 (-) Transcript_3705:2179-3405(-)